MKMRRVMSLGGGCGSGYWVMGVAWGAGMFTPPAAGGGRGGQGRVDVLAVVLCRLDVWSRAIAVYCSRS